MVGAGSAAAWKKTTDFEDKVKDKNRNMEVV